MQCIVLRPESKYSQQTNVFLIYKNLNRCNSLPPPPHVHPPAEPRFRLALTRLPSNREMEIIDNLLHERLEHFQRNPGEAEALLKNPHFTYKPRSRNRTELAAWFYVANTLLNLDETITRN